MTHDPETSHGTLITGAKWIAAIFLCAFPTIARVVAPPEWGRLTGAVNGVPATTPGGDLAGSSRQSIPCRRILSSREPTPGPSRSPMESRSDAGRTGEAANRYDYRLLHRSCRNYVVTNHPLV